MPKKLKLGISAAWSSDSSGWGAPPTSAPADNWGGWGGDSWGNTAGDIWDTVASDPAPADPPPDWGYDDGWDGPAPDFQAEDNFPSLAASKPAPKRGKTNLPPRPKPADFSTVLGTGITYHSGGKFGKKQTERTRVNSQEKDSKSWIQNSIDKNKNKSHVDKLSLNTSAGSTNNPKYSYLKQLTSFRPDQSLQDIIHNPKPEQSVSSKPEQSAASVGPKQEQYAVSVNNKPEQSAATVTAPQPIISNKDLSDTTPSAYPEPTRNEMRPTQPWFLKESTDSLVDKNRVESVTSKPAEVRTLPQDETTSQFPTTTKVVETEIKKPIYDQLREQLQKVSSLGKPLAYIIQNGQITVTVADK